MRKGCKQPERTEKYGLIGGRSLGMYSTTVSMQDWQEKFGVDVEHIDQLEIVRKAEEVDDAQVEKAYKWLTENVGKVEFNGPPSHRKN